MKRRRRILVTGVARWWGALLVRRLIEEPDVAEVVGIDTVEPHHDLGRADFVKLDVRHSLIGKLVRAVGIDTVVHTATTVDSFDLDPGRAHETNVVGTLNLLAGCSGPDSPVRRLVLKSSAHVYGSRFDLPANLREDRRLAADSNHAFVRDIVEVESFVADFGVRNPGIATAILRFTFALNAEEPQPFARYLDLELVPTVFGFDPPVQLVHRDDCVEALRLATVGSATGAFNIAGPHPRPLTALLDEVGKPHLPLLPPLGLGVAAEALRRLRLASLSPQLLDVLRWGRSLSLARAQRGLGFQASRDTAEALADYIEERRVLPFQPDRLAYQYERELEEFIHARGPGGVLPEPNGGSQAAEGAVRALPPPTPRRPRSPRR